MKYIKYTNVKLTYRKIFVEFFLKKNDLFRNVKKIKKKKTSKNC